MTRSTGHVLDLPEGICMWITDLRFCIGHCPSSALFFVVLLAFASTLVSLRETVKRSQLSDQSSSAYSNANQSQSIAINCNQLQNNSGIKLTLYKWVSLISADTAAIGFAVFQVSKFETFKPRLQDCKSILFGHCRISRRWKLHCLDSKLSILLEIQRSRLKTPSIAKFTFKFILNFSLKFRL